MPELASSAFSISTGIKNPDGEYILVPKKRSAYLRVMRNMFSEILEAGGDWLSPDNLLGKSFKVEVVTVTQDRERESLGNNQYSKIKAKTIQILGQ